MAISLVGVTNAPGSTTSVTTFDTAVPSGVQNGDLLLWTLTGNTVTVVSAPSGWTDWQLNSTTAINQCTWSRIASSEPASYTATGLSSNRWGGAMIALRGVDTTTPQDVALPTRNAGTTALTYPAITPVTAGAWIISIGSIVGPSGTVDITWTIGNLDAVDTDAGTNVSASTNCFVSHGHKVWTSGAFTPTAPATATTSTRTIGATHAVRPSSATPQTGNVNRLTTTGVARSLTSTAGAVTQPVNRLTGTGSPRAVARTAGAVTDAIARLTGTGTPRQVTAGSVGPQSRAVNRLTATGTPRAVGVAVATAALPSAHPYDETPASSWREPPSASYDEITSAWRERSPAAWDYPTPSDYREDG